MDSFWRHLPKPFLALAPMEDVTDTVFRRMVAQCARPDVFFTEFVNVEGMFSRGQESVRERLRFTEGERPIVAQIWGTKPEYFYKASKELVEMGFDGIDLNFGCPVKDVVKKGACIALINNRSLASEIIHAAKEGARQLPVSIKTRIGFNTIVTEEWVEFLLGHGLEALTIHGRTAKEMSAVPAHWDEIAKAVLVRNRLKLGTLIIGNGDVRDSMDALEKVSDNEVDGVMIGRGILKNIWAFSSRSHESDLTSRKTMLHLVYSHCVLFDKEWRGKKPFQVLKKYFKIYIHGFPGAQELRERLMRTNSLAEVKQEIFQIVNS